VIFKSGVILSGQDNIPKFIILLSTKENSGYLLLERKGRKEPQSAQRNKNLPVLRASSRSPRRFFTGQDLGLAKT
jgi:hypothetical protein